MGAFWQVSGEAKRVCHEVYRRAIDKGILVRPETCSSCGERGGVLGHHHNYSRPVDVEWLCGSCHAQRHAAQRKAAASDRRNRRTDRRSPEEIKAEREPVRRIFGMFYGSVLWASRKTGMTNGTVSKWLKGEKVSHVLDERMRELAEQLASTGCGLRFRRPEDE